MQELKRLGNLLLIFCGGLVAGMHIPALIEPAKGFEPEVSTFFGAIIVSIMFTGYAFARYYEKETT